MKYFVTGATGFIGGKVAQMLIEAGREVIALVRSPDKAHDLTALGVQLHPGDITQKESMRAGMAGVDGVYHIAGWYKVGVKDKSPGEKINIQGTRNVLEMMHELGIAKGVYTSSLAVNSDTHGQAVDEGYHFSGQHLSEYDRTKAEAHKIADEFIAQGVPLVIVQPGLVYGPGDSSAAHDTFVQYLTRRLPMLPQQTAYAWAHIDDIAQAHIQAMEQGRPGESYIIAGPNHTLIEALNIAEKITGIPAPRLHLSAGMLKASAGLMGVLDNFLPLPNLYTGEGMRIIAGVTYIGDNRKARRELGYQPRSLEEGLRETLAWEMAQLGMKS